MELDSIERKLNTVVIGLEVLTGICAGIQDADTPGEAGVEGDDEGELKSLVLLIWRGLIC